MQCISKLSDKLAMYIELNLINLLSCVFIFHIIRTSRHFVRWTKYCDTMAIFHAGIGTRHCILWGNAFNELKVSIFFLYAVDVPKLVEYQAN